MTHGYDNRVLVTEDNINDIKKQLFVLSSFVTVGCETWEFSHPGGVGRFKVWPSYGRAEMSFGGYGVWGDFFEGKFIPDLGEIWFSLDGVEHGNHLKENIQNG